MEKAKVYLFTSPTCPHCPPAKKFMQSFKSIRDDFDFIELSTASDEGHRKAEKYDVMSVPTYIIVGTGHPTPIGLRGVQNNTTMNKYLDIAVGKKSIEDYRKPTFREKFKDGLKIGKLKIKF
jgi:glutaredoxin